MVLPARDTLHRCRLKGFLELRAAYACERYEQLTGHAASLNDDTAIASNATLTMPRKRSTGNASIATVATRRSPPMLCTFFPIAVWAPASRALSMLGQ